MSASVKNKQEFFKILESRILISDGAMGTALQELGYTTCPDFLNLDSDDLKAISGIHLKYLQAGSEIIQTNSFGSNPIKLQSCGLAANLEQANINAVNAAKEAISNYRSQTGSSRELFIAGNLGPSGKLLEPYGDLKFEDAVDAFSKQARILIDSGADLILIETMIDLKEALVAVEAVRKVSNDIIIACTLSFAENGVTVMGNKADAFGKELIKAGCDIIGANCSVGSNAMIKIVEKIRDANPDARLIIQPNAGLPIIVDGKTKFNETPEIMAENFKEILKFKPSIIGGCCGSTPEHIKKIAELIAIN